MPKRGLPETVRMRHDEHYVEALTASAGAPIGRMVPIDLIDPNPDQPRQVDGRPLRARWRRSWKRASSSPSSSDSEAGDSRSSPASAATRLPCRSGLGEIPVVIREADDAEVLELALVENLQRKDLTAFEEAEALLALMQRCGYTHEQVAQKLGKSRTSITESLALNQMPDDVKNLCRLADIHSKSLLLQIVRQSDPAKMVALIERVAATARPRERTLRQAAAKPKAGRPRNYRFSYKAPSKAFSLQLKFQEVPGRPRRGHLRARGDPRRTARAPKP